MVVANIDQGHGSIVLTLNGRFDFKARHAYQDAINLALAGRPSSSFLTFLTCPILTAPAWAS